MPEASSVRNNTSAPFNLVRDPLEPTIPAELCVL
jgi:hypothetical protein